MDKMIFTISGPTCTGKSTLAKLMVEQLGCLEIVSTTTRRPRDKETHGQDYFFISKAQFEQQLAAGEMIEHSSYGGEYYGLSHQAIAEGFKSNNNLVAVVDPEGAANLRKQSARTNTQVSSIFISNPTDDLLVRLLMRYRCDCITKAEEYAARAKSLLGPEKEWHKKIPYEMKISGFNEENTQSVLDEIRESFFMPSKSRRLQLTG